MNFRKIAIAAVVSASALAALTPSAFAFHGPHGHGPFGHGHFGHGHFGHGGWGHGGWGHVGYYGGGCYPVRYINAFGDLVVRTRCY